MSDEMSLGGILSGEAPPPQEPAPAPEPTPEPAPAPEPVAAAPEPAPATPTPEPAAAPQQQMTDKEKAFYTAMAEERRKRQSYNYFRDRKPNLYGELVEHR